MRIGQFSVLFQWRAHSKMQQFSVVPRRFVKLKSAFARSQREQDVFFFQKNKGPESHYVFQHATCLHFDNEIPSRHLRHLVVTISGFQHILLIRTKNQHLLPVRPKMKFKPYSKGP